LLKDPTAFDTIMAEYRLGHLGSVQTLDGYPAFDTEALTSLKPIDTWAGMAGDDSSSVRQLVATMLSKNADAKYTQTLIKLVTDKDVEVAREAAVGLGKIGSPDATQPLVDALAARTRRRARSSSRRSATASAPRGSCSPSRRCRRPRRRPRSSRRSRSSTCS